MPSKLVIGTRGSALARWQAEHVAELLQQKHRGLIVETVEIKSEGDLDTTTPLTSLGGTGVFVTRLEGALVDRRIDVAVHSLKDMPTTQPEGLVIAGIPARHDARDSLLSVKGWSLAQLPTGAVVGTGSPRRRGQLLHARPDLSIVEIRGNVDTRVRKLLDGEFDAIVLSAAGIERLGIDTVAAHPLDTTICLPAPGQGAIAVEARVDDETTRERVAVLDHEATVAAVGAERAFLRRVDAGCHACAAAYARHLGQTLTLEVLVGDPEGTTVLMERETGLPEAAETLGARLAERLLVGGAEALLARGVADATLRRDDSI